MALHFLPDQQTLSEEVSERTRSRMLKLEKENQSLLRTIEELRAVSNGKQFDRSHRHDHVCHICSTNGCTSSTKQPSGLQSSSSDLGSSTNALPPCSVTQEMLNGHSQCHQRSNVEGIEGVKREILLTNDPDCHIEEKGQLEGGDCGEQYKELISDVEVFENNHNRFHCCIGSRDHSPGSKSSSPYHPPTRSSYAVKQAQRMEAKCKTLETENQHLQASLDNTGISYSVTQSYTLTYNPYTISTIYFFLPNLFRAKGPAPGGRGSGAGGREPESAGHPGGTSDFLTAPGATGKGETEPWTRDYNTGERKEAAGERESTAPSAGRMAVVI